jgi:hypothetical protein
MLSVVREAAKHASASANVRLRLRFLRHVSVERTDAGGVGCWVWLGARQDMHAWRGNERNPRYAGARCNWRGHFRLDGKRWYAHRAAWVLWRGPIPEGLVVRHARGCDTLCVNPSHLRLGTALDNAADRQADRAAAAAAPLRPC